MGTIVVIGSSGSGKSAVQRCLCEEYGYKRVVTCTTRCPRANEVDGVDYHFMSQEEFVRGIKDGAFIECTRYDGNFYGTLYESVSSVEDTVVVLDNNGAKSFKSALGDRCKVVFLDVDDETCIGALRVRGMSEEDILKRMKADSIRRQEALGIADVVIDNSGFKYSPREIAERVVKCRE